MEVEAVDEGTLGKIIVQEGTQGVAVNQVIALLLEEGEDASALDGGGAKPAPKPEAKSDGGGAPALAPEAAPAPAPKSNGAQAPAHEGNRIFASPLAKRMAEQSGLDLSQIQGSGPNGRIVKHDVEAAISGGTAKKGAKPAADSRRPIAQGVRQSAPPLHQLQQSADRCPVDESGQRSIPSMPSDSKKVDVVCEATDVIVLVGSWWDFDERHAGMDQQMA